MVQVKTQRRYFFSDGEREITVEAVDRRQSYRLLAKKLGFKAKLRKDSIKDIKGQTYLFG